MRRSVYTYGITLLVVFCFQLSVFSQEPTDPTDELCLEGELLYREDFGGNDPNDPVAGIDPVPGMSSNYTQIYDTAECHGNHDNCVGMRSGRYLLTKIGYRNASAYTYSHWFIMDDHTYPNDYSRGYLLEIDGRNDNSPLYETVIDGLCAGCRLTFSAYVTNVSTYASYSQGNAGLPQLSFVLSDPDTGEALTEPYYTGGIPVDRTWEGQEGEWRHSAHWRLVGMHFNVPKDKSSIKLTIKNACTSLWGNDFAIDDIEIRRMPPAHIIGTEEVCQDNRAQLAAEFANDEGWLTEPLEYKWWHSSDSVTWTERTDLIGAHPEIYPVQATDSGWFKVAIASAGNIEKINCRVESEPFLLDAKFCQSFFIDTLVCDTLLVSPYTWREHLWTEIGTVIDTIINTHNDSIFMYYTLDTIHCCPAIHPIPIDSAICDTLLPFLWFFRDTMLRYEKAGVQEIALPHAKWKNCLDTVFALTLDTFKCWRFFPIIVNKYNWQLLCDNVTFRRFFPDKKAIGFQWYKNGQAVPGANEDDYAEQNKLNGIYQLQIRLDTPRDSGDEYVWSNILEIGEMQAPEPVIKTVYHWNNLTVIRYRQGDRIWYEKKLR